MRQSSAPPGIRFHHLLPARIPSGQMKVLIGRIFKKHGKVPIAVNYVFCSDQYLLKMNKSYLGHNTLTDIITFDLSESPTELMADIFISAERVKENAGILEIPVYLEFMRVIIHGALHLVGFKDKSESDRVRMRKEEEKYLALLLKNVPRETKAKNKFHVKHRKGVS